MASAPSHDAPAKPGVPVFESCAATCPVAFVRTVVVTDRCNQILTSDAHGETLEGTSRNLSTRREHRHSASPRASRARIITGHSAWRTHIMAKALFGHVGGSDPRMVSEMRRLQKRVRDLEDEISRLQAKNDQLSMAVTEVASSATDREPALA